MEVDKYDKQKQLQDTQNQRTFIYSHLTSLKIYSVVVLFLSSLNFIFALLFMKVYKLQNVANLSFPVTMFFVCLLSIFGTISIIRVEQKLEKYHFTVMSGTFGFEALMVYFRAIVVVLPIVIYQGFDLVFHSHMYYY